MVDQVGVSATAALWGNNYFEGNIGYLRRKTEGGGEPRLIQTVRGVGYVLREGS